MSRLKNPETGLREGVFMFLFNDAANPIAKARGLRGDYSGQNFWQHSQ